MIYLVSGASNDARQAVSSGAVDIGNTSGSSVSQLNGTNHAGLRFQGVNMPQGQAIVKATLTFPQLSNLGGTGSMSHTTVYAENVDNSATFTMATNNVSSRSRTTASGSLGTAPSSSANFYVDVTSQVQAVLNRTGWVSGNALSLLLIGNGTASANFIDPYRQNQYPPVLTITPANGFTTTLKVSQGIDDGSETLSNNSASNTGTTIAINGTTAAGFRFRNSKIERKQAIAKAILRFPNVSAATGSGTLDKVVLQGAADMYGSSSPYNDSGFGIQTISYYAKTFAAVDGTKIAATTAQFQTGIDVTPIVQEILDNITNPGGTTWNPQSTDFIFTFTGDNTSGGNSVTVNTVDGSAGAGAELVLTFANDAIGYATTATQDASGDASFIVGSNPLTLTVTNNANGGWMTGFAVAKGLGFNLPTGSFINGIDVSFDVEGYSSYVANVQLVDNAGVVGYDHSYQPYSANIGGKTTRYFGGSTDKWGRDWTTSDINNANFGVRIKVRNTSGGGGVAVISNIKVVVHYNNDNFGYYTVGQSYKSLAEFYPNGIYTSSGNQAYGQNMGILRIKNTSGRTLNITKLAVPLKAVYTTVTMGGGGKGGEGGETYTYDRSSNPAEIKVYNNVGTTVSGGTLVKTFSRRRTKGPAYSDYELPLDSPMVVPNNDTIAITFDITGVSGVSEPSFISYLGQYSQTDANQKFYRGFSPDSTDGGNGASGIDPSSLVYTMYETVPPAGATMEGNSSVTAAGYNVQFGSAAAEGNSQIDATGYLMNFGSAAISGDSKMYADRIKFEGGSNMMVDGTINPLAITKTYQYKIYDTNWNFLGIWDDVVSNFGYSQEINNAGSAINVTLARNSDTGTAAYDVIADDLSNPIITDDGTTLAAETETLNAIGPGTTVDLNLNVKIYEFSSNTLDIGGDLVFTGYISMYTSQYGSTENTVVSIFSYGADLDNYMLMDGANTRVPYLSKDPSEILTDALDRFNADGGIISYIKDSNPLTDDTIYHAGQTTGYPWYVSYTFNANTMLEVIKKSLELAPTDWFFYPDLATNLLHFKPRPTTPAHYFYLGKHVMNLSLEKTMEGITNDVLFTGGVPNFIISDTFNGPAGANLVGRTSEIGGSWYKHPSFASAGDWTLSGNGSVGKVGLPNSESVVLNTAFMDGTSDFDISADVTVLSNNGEVGLVAAANTTQPYLLLLQISGGVMNMHKMLNGTYTQLGSSVTLNPQPGVYRMRFTRTGNTLNAYWDGGNKIQVQDNGMMTPGTDKGLGLRANLATTNATTGYRVSEFKVKTMNDDRTPKVYKRYIDSSSQALYRRGLDRIQDSRVTLESSADVIVSSLINRAREPRYRSNITISSSTYNIRSIKLGDLVGFRNFGNYVDDVTMQVVRIDYSPDSVQLQLDTLLPSVPKRLEDIKRNLTQAEVSDNPDAPDV